MPCQFRCLVHFTASGWSGAFYPKGLKSSEYLRFYAERFDTVEIDSTFYGCPQPKTVSNWHDRTPSGFIFSVKVPQAITHEKILVDCAEEFETFVKDYGPFGRQTRTHRLSVPPLR